MKNVNLLLAVFLLTVFQLRYVNAQDENGIHTFKIVGITRMPVIIGLPNEKAVEYDPNSSDHLIVSVFNKTNSVINRKLYLFIGKRFDLSKENHYIIDNVLIRDGIQRIYREDGSVENEQFCQAGILIMETGFYPDGKKQFLFSGDERILNGEYKIWFPNGQLNYSGAYKNNRKDGEFRMFDESGTLISQGVYQEGILVSGEAVVHDIVYDNPEIPATYIHGEEAFDANLKLKSSEIEGLEKIKVEKRIDLKLIIEKTGQVTKIESFSNLPDAELKLINSFFDELTEYHPATVEDVPVASVLILKLILSNQGLTRYTNNKPFEGNSNKEFPKFPGGEVKLKEYLSSNIRYPIETLKKKIQGKVFVAFTVTEDGTITDVKVIRGIDMYLDAEAVRVIKNMPKWSPGQINGKPVRVSLTAPINFILQ